MISDEELEEIRASLPIDGPRAVLVDILDPLSRSSAEVEKWKAEAEEVQRRREQARLDMRQREASIVSARMRAWHASQPGFSDLQSDVLAQVIAEMRREFRAEVQKMIRSDSARK